MRNGRSLLSLSERRCLARGVALRFGDQRARRMRAGRAARPVVEWHELQRARVSSANFLPR
jgi:hypothetical protein